MSKTILPVPRLIGPGDPGYEPIAFCEDAHGVAAAVGRGVVLDLSGLDAIDVDPDARTVRAGAGCGWDEIDAATGAYGLATPGPIGHLTRSYGLAIDNLLEAEVVLADGRIVRASADEHPGLFWALRGGSGEFGVVTSSLYRLHEVSTVVGGPTFWPVEQARAVLSAYREFLPAAPRALNGAFTLRGVHFPEARAVCGVLWCYAGSPDDAASVMAPFLDALPEPLLHGVQVLPHAVLRSAFAIEGDRHFVKELPDELRAPLLVHPVDGAAHDIASGDTAWAHRDARWCAVSTEPFAAPVPADDGWECLRDISDRLAAMKATYDPHNIFPGARS